MRIDLPHLDDQIAEIVADPNAYVAETRRQARERQRRRGRS